MISKTLVFNAGAVASDKPYKASRGNNDTSSWNQAEWEQKNYAATQKRIEALKEAQEAGLIIGAKVMLIDGNDFTEGKIVDFVDSNTLAYDFVSSYASEDPKVLLVKFEGKVPPRRLSPSDVVLSGDELAGMSVIGGC